MISKKIMALAVAIGLAPPAMAQTDVTLMYTATAPFVAAFVAKDQGFFEKNGINVTMQLGQNGSVVLAGVVSGSAQVGIPTPTVVFQAVENGLDLRMFAATNIFPDDTISGLVAGVDSGIEKASDLNGRKIGVPGIGGLLHVVMRKWVDENGGDSSTINIVEV
ncbi:MAG: metal ABC transporter substrate-binding protein, partial [Rhodobacteraceae bacterium]